MSQRIFDHLILPAGLTVLLAACAAPSSSPAPAPEPEAATQSAPVVAEFDPVRAEEVMGRPLDGSSPESFEAGLADLRAAVRPEAYERLQSALNWLLFYDINSQGDRATLYRNLDGMTPREIILKGRWRDE